MQFFSFYNIFVDCIFQFFLRSLWKLDFIFFNSKLINNISKSNNKLIVWKLDAIDGNNVFCFNFLL
jgi:hypothetical protein